MNPKEYAQLLYDTLVDKTDEQQDKILERFGALLAKNKHAHVAPAIEKEFQKIQQQSERESVTYITSSSQLSDSQKRELENIFPQPLEFSENPSLLGGIAVRQKDKLFNATLRKKIEILNSTL